MDFFQLQCFDETVKEQSFSEAAYKLSISQSSVSKHIAKLEAELGVKLIDRSGHHVRLTTAGTAFSGYAKILLENYRNMTGTMTRFREEPGINFGCIENIGKSGLTVPISRFINSRPGVRLTFKLDNTWSLLRQLTSGTLNIAIVSKILSSDGRETNFDGFDLSHFLLFELSEDRYDAVVSAIDPVAERSSLSWAELGRMNLVTFDRQYSLNTFLRREFKNAGIEPNILFESNLVDNLVGMAAENAGVTVLSNSISLAGYAVKRVPIDPPLRTKHVLLVEKSIRGNESVDELIRLILQFYREGKPFK